MEENKSSEAEETSIFESDNPSDSDGLGLTPVKFSFGLPAHPSAKSKSKSAYNEEPQENLQYVTEFAAYNPTAQTFKIIPKLKDSWRPPTITNAHLNFEAGMQPAEFEPETKILLNSAINSQNEVFLSKGETQKRKVRGDIERCADEPSLEAYESMPVDEFGEALLRGMGWSHGKLIGRNAKGSVVPYQCPIRKVVRLGLGASIPVGNNAQ